MEMPYRQLAGIVRGASLLGAILVAAGNVAFAQNPGEPLYCQPQEGVTYLIVNGGTGVFTVDPDCYAENLANNVTNTITTGQGGTLTRSAGTGNYIYTPPSPTFVGLDTFSIPVTTVWNAAGGTGSAGGSGSPGGAVTLSITLNVIPATATLSVQSVGAIPIPVPAGSVTGCSASGNPGNGPVSGAVFGCITGIKKGSIAPSHGTLTVSGSGLTYTPNGSFAGTDTFSYQAVGVNNDGASRLDSGDVVVQVTQPAPAPALGTWGMLLLCAGLLAAGMKSATRSA
jgi:hypothetical protein